MHRETTRIGYWLALGMIAMGGATNIAMVKAAEVAVLAPNAVRSVVAELAEAFQRETEHSVRFTFGTTGAVQKRLTAGEATDIVIATDVVMEQMAGQGLVVPDTRTVIARVGIGVGMQEGALKPDISSVDSFRQALLSAKSVTYGDPVRGGPAGIHFSRVMERLGIAHTIKGKPVITTGPICALVAKREVDLCVTQISEILVAKGVTLVGALPRDLQYVSTFVAALASRPSVSEAARAFLEFLVRPSFRAKFAEAGMDYQE